MIAGIVENCMRFSILTNGTLLRDDMARFIAQTGRCDMVQVSLDGTKVKIHDACRGKGSFAGAMAGIAFLKKHHVNIGVRVTVNRFNCLDLEKMAHLLLDQLELPFFSVNAASYLGLGKHNADEIGLRVEDRVQAMEALLMLSREYPDRIGASAGPLAEGLQWQAMEAARRQGQSDIPGGGFLTGCGCVTHKLAVRADGVLVPCTLLGHIELGRINQDDLQAIWQTHPQMQKLRRRRTIPLSGFAFCRECAYISYCTGNCPALAYSATQSVDHPDPGACLKRFLTHGGQLPTNATINVDRNSCETLEP
jgi:SynChlorMet cassette radical SAM/SPASM protein ScmE